MVLDLGMLIPKRSCLDLTWCRIMDKVFFKIQEPKVRVVEGDSSIWPISEIVHNKMPCFWVKTQNILHPFSKCILYAFDNVSGICAVLRKPRWKSWPNFESLVQRKWMCPGPLSRSTGVRPLTQPFLNLLCMFLSKILLVLLP